MRHAAALSDCRAIVACFAVLAHLGCGSAVDLDKPKVALTTALDTWKAGSPIEKLAGQSIVMTDPDWQAGYRLQEYMVKNVSTQPQQGPRVVVALDLLDRAGRKLKKEVGYEVNVNGKTTIGRDPFHVGP